MPNTSFCHLPSQHPPPYMPSPVHSLPVPHASVSPSAGLADTSSISSFLHPHPPAPMFSTATVSTTHTSAAPPAARSFCDAAPSFQANSGPVSTSCDVVPACSVTGQSSAPAAPSTVAALPAISLNSDSSLRFTFDELNLPDLYASFKSLVKTMRERGGSQCKCVQVCLLELYEWQATRRNVNNRTNALVFLADVAPLAVTNNDTTPLHTPTLLPMSPHPELAPERISQYSESHVTCVNV